MATTILVMHVSKHAQPALLYLVPACIGATLGLAVIRGEIKTLFQSVETDFLIL
jgi:minor histocompatibility antigen H13